MRYLEILLEVVSTDSPEFKAWFGASKVVDSNGNPLPVYHGTGRPDRVGTQFRKARATAGPMAYFTDDPTIASGYAMSKPDTSYDGETDYSQWFTIKVGRSWIPITRAWYSGLSAAEKETITKNAPRVTREEFREPEIFLSDDTDNGIGAFKHHLKQARGNYIAALIDEWLLSGALFDDEEEFLKVLKLAGVTQYVRMFDPRSTMPFVYQVFLKIQNPLISTAIPQKVIDALGEAAKRQRYRSKDLFSDQWNKKNTDPRRWFRDLLDDIEQTGGRLSWTVIPDWVTEVLKRFGYDDIHDVGGKNDGEGHTVWIPFEDNQVKSAIANKKFDSSKKNIHK